MWPDQDQWDIISLFSPWAFGRGLGGVLSLGSESGSPVAPESGATTGILRVKLIQRKAHARKRVKQLSSLLDQARPWGQLPCAIQSHEPIKCFHSSFFFLKPFWGAFSVTGNRKKIPDLGIALKSPWAQKVVAPSHHIHLSATQRWRWSPRVSSWCLVAVLGRGPQPSAPVSTPSWWRRRLASSALSSYGQEHFITLTHWYAKWISTKHSEVTEKLTEGIIRDSRHTSPGRALIGEENTVNAPRPAAPWLRTPLQPWHLSSKQLNMKLSTRPCLNNQTWGLLSWKIYEVILKRSKQTSVNKLNASYRIYKQDKNFSLSAH